MPRIPNLESVSNAELNKILTIQSVFDKIYKAAISHQDRLGGYRQPPEVRRDQCDKCHYLGVECQKGSEYEPEDAYNRNCARFSLFDLDAWDPFFQ